MITRKNHELRLWLTSRGFMGKFTAHHEVWTLKDGERELVRVILSKSRKELTPRDMRRLADDLYLGLPLFRETFVNQNHVLPGDEYKNYVINLKHRMDDPNDYHDFIKILNTDISIAISIVVGVSAGILTIATTLAQLWKPHDDDNEYYLYIDGSKIPIPKKHKELLKKYANLLTEK